LYWGRVILVRRRDDCEVVVVGGKGGWCESHRLDAGFERSKVDVRRWWCEGQQGGNGDWWVRGCGDRRSMQHRWHRRRCLYCRHVGKVVVRYHFAGLLSHAFQEFGNVDAQGKSKVGGVRCEKQWDGGCG